MRKKIFQLHCTYNCFTHAVHCVCVCADEAVCLEHVMECGKCLSVEQGKPFSLNIQSVAANGELATLGTALVYNA